VGPVSTHPFSKELTMHHLTTRLGLVGAAAAMLVGGITAGPASAKDGEVVRRGNCTGATDWKLKAKPDDGRLEVEFEVDSNRNGQVWSVRMTDNGVQVFSGTRTTQPPSGSFSVERRIANRAGVDTIRARATNARTGEVCRGSLQI
jgi:hypothetical protein